MLKDKVAIVTGSGEGIGAATAYVLGKKGAKIIIAEIDPEKGKYREKHLKEEGIEALFIRTDVSKESDVINMVNEVIGNFGKIDVLVNNAGIGAPRKVIFEQSLEDWRRIIDVNLTGTWLCSKYAGKVMTENGGGVIVNIASTRAFQSEPNTEPYSASKGGIVALTHSLAISLARFRIRVNCIAPGWIDTSEWKIPPRKPELTRLDHLQHPACRVGRPEDIANLVAFLASDEAFWITGNVFVVDGGMTRKMIYLDEDVIGEAIRLLTRDEFIASKLSKTLVDPVKLKKLKELLAQL